MKNPANLSYVYNPIYCHPNSGPNFGHSIFSDNRTVFYVPANANTDISSDFNVKDNYKDLPKAANGKCMYIDGDTDFQISEVEIYKVIPN